MPKTLMDLDPEYGALILAMNEKAYETISEPDHVPVLPPPRRQVPRIAHSRLGH